MKIRDVTPIRLEEVHATLTREGGKNGRPLAPQSVKLVHTVLHLAFDRAVRLGYLQSNPAATKIAKPRQPRRRPTVWTPADACVFWYAPPEGTKVYMAHGSRPSVGTNPG